MKIISVENPIYSKSDNSKIDCQVTFDDGQVYSFTATAFDVEEHGVELWAGLNSGVYGTIAPYPGLTTAQQNAALVTSAVAALNSSDRTMDRIQEAVALGLNTITSPDVVAWVNYRRALRIIIDNQSGTLPTKPAYPAGT